MIQQLYKTDYIDPTILRTNVIQMHHSIPLAIQYKDPSPVIGALRGIILRNSSAAIAPATTKEAAAVFQQNALDGVFDDIRKSREEAGCYKKRPRS